MSGDGTYAPKSPDLSSFFSSGPTQPPPTSQPVPPQAEPYKSALPQGAFVHQQHHQQQQLPANYHAHPGAHSQPQPQFAGVHALQPHNSASPTYYQVSHYSLENQYPQPPPVTQAGISSWQGIQGQGQVQIKGEYGQQSPTGYGDQYHPYGQYQPGPQAHQFGKQEFYDGPASVGHIPPHPDSQSHRPSQSHTQALPQPQSENMPPRRSAASSSSQQPAAIEPSPVRTKFPTARIKRIMQADEEVGKVAQQTPIAVGKALEMFMIHIVRKSAEVAQEKNSKRVTAAMLKQVVESDEQWDFLREIVSKVDVEDKSGRAGGKAKAESESEEEPVEKKKPSRGGGRKKKAA